MSALRRRSIEELLAARRGGGRADAATSTTVAELIAEVRRDGLVALRRHAERFGDVAPGAPLLRSRAQLEASLAALPAATRGLLERTAARIAAFARAQRDGLRDVDVAIAASPDGGRAGARFVPFRRAGCYAPGGRHPLPSSLLMTAVTARVAGVREVVVATPRPSAVIEAAAALAGADALLAAGGASAIAALALGVDGLARCDVVVGPGNRFVTAAKEQLAGEVEIDLLAGPSELVVLAAADADPAWIAADLLAQAEHDDDALPLLVACDGALVAAVERELDAQLATLPTAATARAALANGGLLVPRDLAEGAAWIDALAPEHVELHGAAAEAQAARIERCGTLFVGAGAAEVLGDYGAGPNHVLPTGGAARTSAGLSVLTFLRARTWLAGGGAPALLDDAIALARLEGLEGHARAAERRRAAAAGASQPAAARAPSPAASPAAPSRLSW